MYENLIPSLGTTYLICDWVIRIVMLLVVPWRRTPEATRSWLLLIFFLPIAGLLLYLAIGRPRFPSWRRARFARLAPFLTEISAKFERPVPPRSSAAKLVERLGGWLEVGGNEIDFLDDYDGVIQRLVGDIDRATGCVRILVYIFADDATGLRVIDALGRAVRRGVVCHVLIDPVGSRRWVKGTVSLLRDVGVETREALPFHWFRRRTRRDMRNHRKLFLIDEHTGYVGSQNIVDKDFRPGVTNRELVVRMTGPVAAQLAALFVSDWYLETETMLAVGAALPPVTGSAVAQLLPSGANYGVQGFETLLVAQIHAARDHVLITTPYLIPDEGMLGALRSATLRKVTVDLIVSVVVDQPLVSLAQRSYYDELLEAGVRIHRYRDDLLHAKNVSIDGRLAIVGSSNVDIRSFQLNEEVSLLLYDSASVEALKRIQRDYIANSDELDLGQWRRRGRPAKIVENLARLVTPLL